jgi:transglutaminase-like putative cysteine protease
MAESDKSVTELMKQAGSIPEYQQMMNYLSARNATPTIAAEPKLNFSGVFRPGATFSAPGSVGIRPKEPVEALVHEVTHAADIQMISQYMQESGRTSSSSAGPFKSTQFTDAYDKLDPSPLTKLMQPDWATRASKYRATRPESRAFAVENMTGPNVKKDSVTRAPGHVDATIATEFMILLELAQRSSGKPAAKSGR